MDQFGRSDIFDGDRPKGMTPPPSDTDLPSEKVKSGDTADPKVINKRTPDDQRDGYYLGIDPVDHILKFVLGGLKSKFKYMLGGFRFDLWKDSEAGNAIYINDERIGNLPSVDIRRKNGTGGGMYVESDSGTAVHVKQTSDTTGLKVEIDDTQAGNGAAVEAIANEGSSAPASLNRARGSGVATYDNIEDENSDSPIRIGATVALVSDHFWRLDRFLGGDWPGDAAVQIWLTDGTDPNGALSADVGDLCYGDDGIYKCDGDGAGGSYGDVWHLVGDGSDLDWGIALSSDQSSDLIGYLGTIRTGAAALTTAFYAQKQNAWTDWATATDYVSGQRVKNGGTAYRCILDHTSDAASEPGVGGSWATYWTVEAIPAQELSFCFQADMGADGKCAGFHAFGIGSDDVTADSKHFIGWERSTSSDKRVLTVGNGEYDQGQPASGYLERAFIRSDGAICFTNGDPTSQKFVGLKPPSAAIAADVVWEMPAAEGDDGDCLMTDGAGVLGWGQPPRELESKVFADDAALATGDGKLYVCVPEALDGWSLDDFNIFVSTSSSSGLPTVQVHNVTTGHDLMSTRPTIDVGEYTSYSAATPPVVDPTYKTVSKGDILRFDVDAAGTGAKGLGTILRFVKP